jgi:chloramphenicol 3-O-phosphotransferase
MSRPPRGRILVLSGPPGAGKGTVAKELIAASQAPTVCIEGDTFWHFIVKGGSTIGRKGNSRTVVLSMTLAAMPYARAGYEVIVDFSIGPWTIDWWLPHMKDIPVYYVVLCPSAAVCAERAAKRTEGCMPDYSQYLEVHQAYCDLGQYERHAIRDDTVSATETAARIRAGAEAEIYRIQPLGKTAPAAAVTASSQSPSA